MKCSAIGFMLCSLLSAVPAGAIETLPGPEQIAAALDAGRAAAKERRAPDSFYVRFGAEDELHPSGFLITKLGALSVMATHMTLRGLQPTEADVAQVVSTKTMLVSTVIFGDVPAFAQESYIVFDQAGRTIKPVTVRFDGQANRSAAWPERPRFKAKVVASFDYNDFDPRAKTTITVFPASGGADSFVVDFAGIQ
ncbi:MAG: hypothetical protein K2X00_19755 [Nitrospiraceae bacterium]|jgi:hypothetical protein|nr:hypothetical protein [Nitrospiraceae bacterium]OQW64326.1 MAG: hypothetical protein BVN29_13615 [Nitrospira sp. ST-bin5]